MGLHGDFHRDRTAPEAYWIDEGDMWADRKTGEVRRWDGERWDDGDAATFLLYGLVAFFSAGQLGEDDVEAAIARQAVTQ